MKLNVLRTVGHNIADSFASGTSLLIAAYEIDVFGEARVSSGGHILVDFLTGTCIEGQVSPALARYLEKGRFGLLRLCVKHGVPFKAFRMLAVRFWSDGHLNRFEVTVEDQRGRRVVDQYEGNPGRRRKVLDPLGRIRRAPTARTFRALS
jgi:hypothetical protein